MATFSDVYKQELKSKGILSSIGSAALKRTREKLDVRNMLFGGSGAVAATGRKVFGKGYQAIQKDTPKVLSKETGMQSVAMDQLLVSAQRQETQLSIIAKNTMNSNAMARDINVMRQNIMKLVTMSGGKASRGADMFFKDAAGREAAYESQFKKKSDVKETTPTVEKSKSGGLLGMLGGIATVIVGAIKSTLGGIPGLLKNIFSIDNLLKVFGIAGNVISGIAKLLPMLVSPAFLGIIAAVAGATWLMKWLESKNDEANTQEKTDLRTAQDRGSQASKLAARTILINDDLKSLLAEDRTDQDVSDYTRGEIKTKSELSKAIVTAEKTGKQAIELKESVVATEAQERLHNDAMRSMQDGSYAAVEAKRFDVKPEALSPTPSPTPAPATYNAARDSQAANTPTKVGEVSENLVNFVKKKEGFSPRAFWDHKQWSIGYGTKSTEGEVITEREADKRLREVLQKSQDSVLAHARKNNYDFNQNQVDALTSFVYNLGPGILNQLTGKGSRSIEQIAAKIPEYNKASGKIEHGLQKRRAEEYAMFTSPSSNTGSNLQQGSRTLEEKTRQMSAAPAPNVVVNTPPAPAPAQVSSMGGGSVTMASVVDDEFARRVLNYVGA
jgi:GH24 family phage-related lysozyme (muramidase)